MKDEILKKYASLLVKTGVNLQRGQELVINCDVEAAYFARTIAECAYAAGAKKVTALYSDEKLMKIRYGCESVQTLENLPDWFVQSRNCVAENKCAYIAVISDDPDIFAEVSADKTAAYSRACHARMKKFYDASMNNDIRWCIAAVPGRAWAKKMFPGAEQGEAEEELWKLIVKAVRLDEENPAAAWKRHKENLQRYCDFLNGANLRSLRYENSIGTDFYVELPENYRFTGGAEVARDGADFVANIPTEEVFAAPRKDSAEGRLVASMPLVHNGKTVENFSMDFKGGKIVSYRAERGEEVLKRIIETDEGSRYLGEIALVGCDSPIQRLGRLFYNTLFDENASCHFAIGKAYPCIAGAENMTGEELERAGLNDSKEHVDFMVGTPDLSITGTDKSGGEIPVFRDGKFVI